VKPVYKVIHPRPFLFGKIGITVVSNSRRIVLFFSHNIGI